MFIATRVSFFSNFGKKALFSKNLACNFSNLKDNFSSLRQEGYSNMQQFYTEMRKFESSLPHTEWVKFKKLIHEANKKVRKLNKIQSQKQISNTSHLAMPAYKLDGSITSEYFYHKHTQSIYFKQQIPHHKLGEQKPQIKNLSLQQINKLVDFYFTQQMQPLLFNITPFEEKYQQLFKLVTIRFQAIEQILCRHIFQGYTEFTNHQENLFFKTQQKYKGNFKFLPLDPNNPQNMHIIKTFSQIVKKLTCLNQCRPKLRLALEMILSENWKSLEIQTLSNLLFCTSVNGKDLHQITTNFDQFSQRLLSSNQENKFFNLLLYMSISGVESKAIFQKADSQLANTINKLNSFQKLIFSAMIPFLSQAKQIDFIEIGKIKNLVNLKYENEESDCLKLFTRYLTQKQYRYEVIPSTDKANIIAPYQMVEIQNKKFLCYSNLFYHPQKESNTPNGLAKLINQYFNKNNEKIKIINGKKLTTMQKWTQKQEYLKSKIKGLTKPQIKKQSKFNFYSPREEYFENKQKQSK